MVSGQSGDSRGRGSGYLKCLENRDGGNEHKLTRQENCGKVTIRSVHRRTTISDNNSFLILSDLPARPRIVDGQSSDSRRLFPVEDCVCKVCSTKKGFCSECMCLVCLNFDCANNTCSWGEETLMKELDYVRKIFQGSEDLKGKELHVKADVLHTKLVTKMISPSDACDFIFQR
ncbi:hypothetical protein KY284_030515 [Solanum tuberosum]|nr:hypothetical protein KY284_030515 [Solanum tuberosum]